MLNKSVRKHPETEWSGYATLHKARLALYYPSTVHVTKSQETP